MMKINGVKLKGFPETEIMMNEWKCPKCGAIRLEENCVVGAGCCDGIEMEQQDLALMGQRYEVPNGDSVWVFF